MYMDHRLMKASDFKYEAEIAVRYHHHHSRVYRAICPLVPAIATAARPSTQEEGPACGRRITGI